MTKPEFGALELRAAHPERINYIRLSPTADVSSRALAAFATHDLDAESALVVVEPEWEEPADFTKAFTALGGQVAQRKLGPGASLAAALAPLRGDDPPDVVVYAGDLRAADFRRAMRTAGHGSTPLVTWDGFEIVSGAVTGSSLQRAGKAAIGTYDAFPSFASPRADFVDAYRSAFGEEPTDYAAAAYACVQIILASLQQPPRTGRRPTGSGRPFVHMPSILPSATRRCSEPWASTRTVTRRSKWCRSSAWTPRRPTARATGSS